MSLKSVALAACLALAPLLVAPPARATDTIKPPNAAGPSATATAAAPSYAAASWFKLLPDVQDTWVVENVGADPWRAKARLKSPTGGKPKRVVVFYPRPSSAYDVAISTILDAFESRDMAAEFDAVNFRNDPAQGAALMRRIQAEGADLIIAMGSESAAYLHQHHRNGAIPIVTVCAKDPVSLGQMKDYESGSGAHIAYTSLNMPIEVQMAYLMELSPQLKNVSILVDAKNVSAVQTQAEPIAAKALAMGLNVIDGVIHDPNKAQEEVGRVVAAAVDQMRKSDPDLKRSVFIVTGSTSVFKEIATINQHSANVPVVSLIPEVVQAGDNSAAVSIGISFESNAQLAAGYAIEILQDPSKVLKLKVGIVSPPDIAINFRRVRAIGMKVPFSFFEAASFVYDYEGRLARARGQTVGKDAPQG